MTRKKRVLLVNEASQLATGFSTIGNGIMHRLLKTGKYELFELGNYLEPNDPRVFNIAWKQYLSMPDKRDREGNERYHSTQDAQFGALAFEQVCLDCMPDIVINITDEWMQQFIIDSPYRKNFKYIKMACVDGFPQKPEWMDNYKNCDLLLTYTKFGKDTIETESGGSIKVFDIVNPGVDDSVFKPLNAKKELRAKWGIPEDANVIFTVMRNQKRKLFPDMFRAFRLYIEECLKNNRTDLAKNTYLICNTSFPDVGWDFGKLLIETGIGSRILFGKKCDKCGASYLTNFEGEIAPCRKCGRLSARHNNSNDGLSRSQLCELYNCSDLAWQYSICEGFGLMIAEAKACGIPVIGVTHSGMKSQLENTPGCFAIDPITLFDEPVTETEQKRAMPNNKETAKAIYRFFTTGKEIKNVWSEKLRKDAIENFSYDRAAKVFETAIDSLEVEDHENTWKSKNSNFIYPSDSMPTLNSNSDFVDWCLINILRKPNLVNTYWRDLMIRYLNAGIILERGGRGSFTRENFIDRIKNMANKHNYWEHIRLQHFELEPKNNKTEITIV